MLLFSEGTETGGPRKGRGLPIFHPYLGERRWQTGTAECRQRTQILCLETRWSTTQGVKKAGLNARLPNVGAGDGIRTRDILLGRQELYR